MARCARIHTVIVGANFGPMGVLVVRGVDTEPGKFDLLRVAEVT